MTPEKLQHLYEAELGEALEWRDEKGFDIGGFRLLRSISGARGVGDLHVDDSRVWVWSDLHLGDVDTLVFFGRPFGSVDEMDDALVAAWRDLVGLDDVIVCVGDATKGRTAQPSLERLGALPGIKILVFGNHDRSVRGFDQVVGSLYSHGDPPLLLTHVPLRRVPAGCVNVHGHLHRAKVKGSVAHINVSVEQVGYRPQPLDRIRRLARLLERGRDRVPAGRTTADWLASLP